MMSIVLVHGGIAIVARWTKPAIQFDVSGSGRVGMQNPLDDRKEIEEPPFFQGSSDRGPSFARAQTVAVHMRVSRIGARRCRVRLQGDYRIRGLAADAVEIETNLKRPQLDAFQGDRLGRHRESRIFDVQAAKLGFRRH
jgi:hypothetical protein